MFFRRFEEAEKHYKNQEYKNVYEILKPIFLDGISLNFMVLHDILLYYVIFIGCYVYYSIIVLLFNSIYIVTCALFINFNLFRFIL